MRIHHVAFRTIDLPRLESFYVGLGLSIRKRSAQSVWFVAGDTILMIEQAEEREPAIAKDSMEMIAFTIEPHEVDVFRQKLRALNVPIESETAFTLYFRDPDGRRLGLSHFR